MPQWSVPIRWPGGTVFVIAGGPSVARQQLDLLAGQHIVGINCAYQRMACFGLAPPHLPHLDYLLAGDNRWIKQYRYEAELLKDVPLVTVARVAVSDFDPRWLKLVKRSPPGLQMARNSLTMRRTTITAAINFCVHLAPGGRVVLLGADGHFGADGSRNHHRSHPWKHRDGCWQWHHDELATLKEPLAAAGVEVLNASPGTAWPDLFPVVELEQVIDGMPDRSAAVA